MDVYEVRPRKDHRRRNLISNALPFGRLWYDGPNAMCNAIGYAEYRSRSHDAVIRVYGRGEEPPAGKVRLIQIRINDAEFWRKSRLLAAKRS